MLCRHNIQPGPVYIITLYYTIRANRRLSLWDWECDQTRSVLPSGEWLLPPGDHMQNRILCVQTA